MKAVFLLFNGLYVMAYQLKKFEGLLINQNLTKIFMKSTLNILIKLFKNKC